MKKKRHGEVRVIAINSAQEHGITEGMIYARTAKIAGMGVAEAK